MTKWDVEKIKRLKEEEDMYISELQTPNLPVYRRFEIVKHIQYLEQEILKLETKGVKREVEM